MASALERSEKFRAHRVLMILREKLTIHDEDFAAVLVAKETCDPFRVLIVTILSQSCTDIAAMRAYKALDKQVGIIPIKLSNANSHTIERAICVAGLHRQKSKAIKSLSQIICDKYSGKMNKILDLPFQSAREKLQELPKVGPKTADVLLSILGLPTISVDTHVERVSKRLELTGSKSKYEQIRTDLMHLFNKKEYSIVPLLFMAHGRNYCKARRPLCPTCPVENWCHYSMKTT
ncbi:MAG: endonuclease III [Candidatus Bathyarchaeia archaeon]|jgi:endonuclease-3